MKDQDLKSLAHLISGQSRIDNKVIDYIIKKLNMSDLRLFKKYLDQEITKKKLFVKVASDSSYVRENIEELFPNRDIEVAEDESLGGGIYIVDNDNHYDLSIRNKIDSIIESLKN